MMIAIVLIGLAIAIFFTLWALLLWSEHRHGAIEVWPEDEADEWSRLQ